MMAYNGSKKGGIEIKKILSVFLAVALALSTVSVVSAAGFADVGPSQYFYDAVLWAAEQEITNGYGSADTFCPEVHCSRGQIVTFLWRAAGEPQAAGENPFTDVKPDDYFYGAVLWAVEQGITNGYGREDIFCPDAACTREQIVTFLWRFRGSPAAQGELTFGDVAKDGYSAGAVAWAVEKGITNGYGGSDTFAPGLTCTRGQAVTFLYRAMTGTPRRAL